MEAMIDTSDVRRWKRYNKLTPTRKEWLGELPDHWQSMALRRVVTTFVDYRGKTPKKVSQGVRLVTASNVRAGKIDYEAVEDYISNADYEPWMVRGLSLIHI